MLCGSIAVFFLVGLFSPVSGDSSTITMPEPMNSVTSATPQQATTTDGASVTATQTKAIATAINVASQTAVASLTPVTPSTPVASLTSGVSPPSSTSAPSTSASVTASPEKPSCAEVSFIAEEAWNASLAEPQSQMYNEINDTIQKAMKDIFNDSKKYKDVEVSQLEYSEKDGMTLVKLKLCLVVVTSDNTFIVALVIAKLQTGYLSDHEGIKVKKDSVKFKPLGVEFKDWRAKDGECANKCEGAGGEFTIEGICVSKESSCKGIKTTKMTKDCVKYCDSSAGTYTVSFLIMAMGILLSFSFQ